MIEGDLVLLAGFVALISVSLLLLELGMRRVAKQREADLRVSTPALAPGSPARLAGGLSRGKDGADPTPHQRLHDQD